MDIDGAPCQPRHRCVTFLRTGGPGQSKTTLLGELAVMGFATVEESATTIVAERLAHGASPRPDARTFAREFLQRDV